MAPTSAALRGRIRGTARDMTRKPVAGLLVRLISSDNGLIHVTNTDDKGVYSFEDVESPRGRLAEKLWREQNERWPLETAFARPQSGQAPLASEDFRSRLDATLPV